MLTPSAASAEERVLFEKFYQEIEENFEIQVLDEKDIPIEELELFKHYDHFAFEQVIKIVEGEESSYVAPIQVKYSYIAGKGGTYSSLEFQAWAFCWLPKKFGHLIIKREGVSEKIMELIQPLEMNFPDDKSFCRKYYVLSKDQAKATQLLNAKFRQAIKDAQIKDLHLEVFENFLIAGDKKGLGNGNVVSLARLVHQLSNIRY